MNNTNMHMYRDLLPLIVYRLSDADARAAQTIADAISLGAPVNIVQLTTAARIIKENRIALYGNNCYSQPLKPWRGWQKSNLTKTPQHCKKLWRALSSTLIILNKVLP